MNRKVGGVVCYVRNDLSYVEKDFFPEKTENILWGLTPEKKPFYCRSLKILPNLILWKKNYTLLVTSNNLHENQDRAGYKNNNPVSATVSNDVLNYLQFCTVFGLT